MRKRHKYAVAPELTVIVLLVLISAIFLTVRTAVTQRQQSQSNADTTITAASQSGKLASGSAQPALDPAKLASGAGATGSAKPNPATGSAKPKPPAIPPESIITPQYFCIGSGSSIQCNIVGSGSGYLIPGTRSGGIKPPPKAPDPCALGSGTATAAATQNAILAAPTTRKKLNGLLGKLIGSVIPPQQAPAGVPKTAKNNGNTPCPPANTKPPTASGSGLPGAAGKCSKEDTAKGYSYCYGDGPNSDRCLPPGESCTAPSTPYKDGSNKGSYCVDQNQQAYTPAGGTPNIGASGSAQPVDKGTCSVCPKDAQVKDFDPAKSGQATTCQCNDPLIIANDRPLCVKKIPNCNDNGHTGAGTCNSCMSGFTPNGDGTACMPPPPPPPPPPVAGAAGSGTGKSKSGAAGGSGSGTACKVTAPFTPAQAKRSGQSCDVFNDICCNGLVCNTNSTPPEVGRLGTCKTSTAKLYIPPDKNPGGGASVPNGPASCIPINDFTRACFKDADCCGQQLHSCGPTSHLCTGY